MIAPPGRAPAPGPTGLGRLPAALRAAGGRAGGGLRRPARPGAGDGCPRRGARRHDAALRGVPRRRPVRAESLLAGQPPVLERPLPRPDGAARARPLGRGPHGARGPARGARRRAGRLPRHRRRAARRARGAGRRGLGDDARRAALEAYVAATPAPGRLRRLPRRRRTRRRRGPPPTRLRAVGRRAPARGGGTRRGRGRLRPLPRPAARRAPRGYDVAAEPESFAWASGPARRRTCLAPRPGLGAAAAPPRGRRARRAIATRSPACARPSGTPACCASTTSRASTGCSGSRRASTPPRGVYVRYPAEELYAIVLVEAHRRGAVVVGEDLGTVPAGRPRHAGRARDPAQLRAAVRARRR